MEIITRNFGDAPRNPEPHHISDNIFQFLENDSWKNIYDQQRDDDHETVYLNQLNNEDAKFWFNKLNANESPLENPNDQDKTSDQQEESAISVPEMNSEDDLALAAKFWFNELTTGEPVNKQKCLVLAQPILDYSNDQDQESTISVSEINSEDEMKRLADKIWSNELNAGEPILEENSNQGTFSDQENTILVSEIHSEDEMKALTAKIWFNELNAGESILEEKSNDQETLSDQENIISDSEDDSEDEMTLDAEESDSDEKGLDLNSSFTSMLDYRLAGYKFQGVDSDMDDSKIDPMDSDMDSKIDPAYSDTDSDLGCTPFPPSEPEERPIEVANFGKFKTRLMGKYVVEKFTSGS